jgi:hypothetical protein
MKKEWAQETRDIRILSQIEGQDDQPVKTDRETVTTM